MDPEFILDVVRVWTCRPYDDSNGTEGSFSRKVTMEQWKRKENDAKIGRIMRFTETKNWRGM